MLPLDTKPWASQAHRAVAPYPPPRQHEPQTWSMTALPAFPRWSALEPLSLLQCQRAAGRTPWPCQTPQGSERGWAPAAGRSPGEDTAPGSGAGPHCLLPLVIRAATNLHESGLECHLTPDYHQQPLGTHSAAVAKRRTGLSSGVFHLKLTQLAHCTVAADTEPRLIRGTRARELLTLTLTSTQSSCTTCHRSGHRAQV